MVNPLFVQQMAFLDIVVPFIISLIIGILVLFFKGKTEAVWIMIPLLIFSLLWGLIGLALIIIIWFLVRPDNKKWNEEKRSYWFSIGVVTGVGIKVMMMLVGFVMFF